MLLIGGHPALDFVNADPQSFEDLRQLAAATGLATRAELKELGGRHDTELAEVRGLRALLHAVFGAGEPRRADLDALARAWATAIAHATLRAARGRVALGFDVAGSGPALIRHRLLQRAIELLTSDARARIGSCPSCAWLFVDTSKNRSRRWCSMQACGSASKSRAYYRRRKAKTTS